MKLAARQFLQRTLGPRLTATVAAAPRSIRSGVTRVSDQTSKSLLRKWHDRYRGRTVLLIANGPSLAETDWSLLSYLPAVTTNRAYLQVREWGLDHAFHVVANKYIANQFSREISRLEVPKFLTHESASSFTSSGFGETTAFFQNNRLPSFQKNIPISLWSGSTVTFVALQLLYWMGAETVIIVGLDHEYVAPGRPNELVTQRGDDINHFRPDYFPAGIQWQNPDLATTEVAYSMAEKNYRKIGRRILNASERSAYHGFQRVDLRTLDRRGILN